MTEINYPPEVTPLGEDMIFDGIQPMMGYRSYDGNVVFHLMGGLAPWPGVTEGVLVKDIKGLIPPWSMITQKGATQDGVTVLDALYDPMEVEFTGEAVGNTPKSTRKVIRDWYDSWDPKKTGELFWITHEMGYWWAPVRWLKSPLDNLNRATACAQQIGMVAQADSGFWRSYDDTSSFQFAYDSITEDFSYTDTDDMGVNWPTYFYDGAGAGFPRTNGTAAYWSTSGTGDRAAVIGPYKDFDTDTDNQVTEITLGSIPGTYYAEGPYNDIWGRMSVDGSGNWDGDGIRARIGRNSFYGWVELSRFNNFVKTTLFSRRIGFRPKRGDKFRLVCGTATDPRMFKVFRNGVQVLAHKEVGTGSLLGSAYRGVGFGMKAAAGTTQKAPAQVTKFTAGDNATITQSGFFACTNVGDQDCYYDYTAFGPFTKLKIWDGPGSNDFIEFGPLSANQAALLRTDPRDRNVYDLAAVPANPSPQEKTIFEAALNGLLSFITLGGANPILSVVQSIFGIFGGPSAPALPQGNFYAFLKGRFSDNSGIPAKSPGMPAQTQFVKVEVQGGNADTLILCSGTPLRRYPL